MAVEDQQGFYPERHPDDGDCDTWRDLAEVVQGDGAPEDQTELLSPIILHVDVDSFYCEVERMDDPSLRGKPLAVQQFNSGGFVAVSYEAKAAGVKKGDGVGAAGRANIETLKEIGAVSMEEARRRCPGLVVKPMRTERYREVALRMQEMLRPWALGGEVEKASYDDFYLNLDPTAAQRLTGNTKPQSIHVVGCGSAEELPRDLMDACCAASAIQHASSRLGLSTSVGVSRSKLLSRLLSPLHKPAAITALADAGMADFLHSQPIRRVPGLQGKLGRQVCEVLGAESVGDLRRFARVELVDKFGEATAAMLSDLANVRLSGTVRERVAPKTIICERSCPPTSDEAPVAEMLRMLAASLAERVLDDAARHARVPSRLSFHWRQGYASGVRCRSAPLPSACSAALRRFLSARASEQSGGAEGIRESLAAPLALSSLSLLRQNVPPPWNLTRIVVGVSFAGGGTGAQTSKEGTILAFMQRKKDKACSKAEDPEGLETPSPSPGHKENGGCREGGCQVLAGHTKKCRTTPETRMSNHLSPGQPEEGTGGCRGGKVSEEVSLSGIDVAEQWRILETIQKRQGQQRERGQRTIDSMFKRPLR